MREPEEWERQMYEESLRGHWEWVAAGYMNGRTYVPPVRRWVPRQVDTK